MRLIYISPVSADAYAQRPHFMVRTMLDWGVDSVLWVNPYPCRLPCWTDLNRIGRREQQAEGVDRRIRVLNVPAAPVEPLPLGAWLNRRLLWSGAWREIEQFVAGGPTILGIGRPCSLALTALRQLRHTSSFYDAMDNFPEFHQGLSRRAMRRHEDAIASEVDLLIASSTFLANKFARRGLRVEKILNACELMKIEGERRPTEGVGAVDSMYSALRRPSSAVVLGYIGCIGRWFDWPLVVRLAESMPRARIDLIGPRAVEPPSRKKLPANIWLHLACPQSKVAGHLKRFSLGLIPFRSNALTAGVDPIKYYEYRAAGLPVLSTRFGEMAARGGEDGVYFLDESDDPASAVASALGHTCDVDRAEIFLNENSWTRRFNQSRRLRSIAGRPPYGERTAAGDGALIDPIESDVLEIPGAS